MATRRKRMRIWFWALAGLMVTALTVLAGYLQFAQYQRLNPARQLQTGTELGQAYQLEREHASLRLALQQWPDMAGSAAVVQARYAELLDFYKAFSIAQAVPNLSQMPQYATAMQAVGAFEQTYGAQIQALDQHPLAPSEKAQLLAAVEANHVRLQQLSNVASAGLHRQMQDSYRTVQAQGLVLAGLTGVMAMVMLATIAGLLVNVRRQRQQNKALEVLAARLRETRVKAEEASNAKSLFLANMSHEIRTPFQGMIGMLELLTETPLNALQQDYVKTAHDSAQHLLRVVNDIMEMSTLETGAVRLMSTPVDLLTLLREIERLMRPAAEARALQFRMTLEPGVPAWVRADATRVRQICFNLLNNAIKFTESGWVGLHVAPLSANGDGIRITVFDSGMGMDAKTVQNLFSRFYQADASIRRRFGGTGLGLEISRGLARLMGGDITVESEPGKGSQFIVELPLLAMYQPEQQPQAPHEVKPQRALKVLVAEDYAINRKYLEVLLASMGHDATFCENGKQALEAVQRERFDVILMDFHMPVMDGLSATRQIRQLRGEAGSTWIVVITADVTNETRQRAMDAGADDLIIKPVRADNVSEVLAKTASRTSRQTPGGVTLAFPAERQVARQQAMVERQKASPNLVGGVIAAAPPGQSAPKKPATRSGRKLIDENGYRDFIGLMPRETTRRMLGTLFVSNGDVRRLAQAIKHADRSEAGRIAHQVKGAAQLTGLTELATVTARIEHLALNTHEPLPKGLARELIETAVLTKTELDVLNQHLSQPVSLNSTIEGPVSGQSLPPR